MLDLGELADGLMVTFQRHLPSDFVSFNEVGPDPDGVISIISPAQPEHLHEAWARWAFQNPLVDRYVRTRDGRPYRFSDVVSVEDYHRLELYRDVYGPIGVEHQIAFVLPATPGRILAIALSRRDRDYSDAERDLIERARPFLIQAWRNAVEHTALREELAARPAAVELESGVPTGALADRGLTERQVEVLALVARGRSNRNAAAILGISDRTVQKHLEHCYRTLGVAGRSAAAELFWTLVATPPAPPASPNGGPAAAVPGSRSAPIE